MPHLRILWFSFLALATSAIPLVVFAQPVQSMRGPGDHTLFGDPQCSHWLRADAKAKETWLHAILAPINMGYVHRERPAIDRFSSLPSLAPAAKYVDVFCESRRDTKAMNGAIKYFEELISDARS
jgi:hypothetical protein